ncbi:MAG: hypothetical protein JWN44_1253 [Myxococcales bacterium]|nr:hypothetical protein [Myxococcales bacterium]
MRQTIVLAALLVVGCGKGTPTYKAGANVLTVQDSGYYYTDNHFDFCPGGGAGQLLIDLVDYNFICDPTHPSERDVQLPHLEMRIILTIGVAPDFNVNGAYPTMKPYEVQPADCQTGGAPAVAQFLHYTAGVTQPDSVVAASSGSVTITQFDPTRTKPLKGSFDLHFGGDQVKDSFSLFNCN